MRLTVHLANARRETVELPSKEKPGSTYKKEKTFNTLSFHGVNPEDVDRILSEIESEKLGIPVKHYLSGERIPGKARGKKKS
jgi:hypothetical protein